MAFEPYFGTGFEMGAAPLKAGMVTGNSGTTTTGNLVHTGTYALAYTSGGTTFFAAQNDQLLDMGIWVRPGVSGNARITFTLDVGNSPYLTFVEVSGTLYQTLYVNNVLVATGTYPVSPSTYHNLQISVDISQTGHVYTQVNGVPDISYDGDLNLTASVLTGITLSAPAFNDVYWDDLVMGTGGWPGDIRFDALIPNGDSVAEWLQTGRGFQAPPAAPTLGLAAGPGLTGDYRYKITLVDVDGETMAGAASSLVQPVNQVVALSAIPTGLEGTTARKIYRTAAGGSTYLLLTTISDNTTTTYNDSTADGSLGAAEPVNVLYTQIDERPPSETDYIRSAIDGDQAIHTLTDWDATKKLPLFILHFQRCFKGTADTQQIRFILKSGATVEVSAPKALYSSTQYEYELHLLDPDGFPWTNAVLDALESGQEAEIP